MKTFRYVTFAVFVTGMFGLYSSQVVAEVGCSFITCASTQNAYQGTQCTTDLEPPGPTTCMAFTDWMHDACANLGGINEGPICSQEDGGHGWCNDFAGCGGGGGYGDGGGGGGECEGTYEGGWCSPEFSCCI